MVIVPEETLDRMQNALDQKNSQAVELKTVQTPGDNLSRLDSEMYDILHSNKDEGEKSQQYLQTLRKYLFFKNGEREDERESDDDSDEDTSTPLSDDAIVENMPKPLAKKVRELLRHLKSTAAGRLTWDSNGAVRIDGQGIKNSNISELANYAVKSTANRRGKRLLDDDRQLDEVPEGHATFLNLVKSTQPPKNVVGNNVGNNDVAAVNTLKRKRQEPVANQPFEVTSTPVRTAKRRSILHQTLPQPSRSTPAITRSVAATKKKWLHFDLA